MRPFRGHKGPVRCLAYAPDGRTLASGSEDGTVRLWDVSTAQERLVLRGFGNYVRALAFSRDGERLAAATHRDNRIRLWDAASGQECGPWRTTLDEIHTLLFGDTFLVAGGRSTTWHGHRNAFHVFDVESGRPLRSARGPGQALGLAADGKGLACATPKHQVNFYPDGRGVGYLVLVTGRQHARPEIQVVACAPAGAWVLAAGQGAVTRWEIEPWEELERVPPLEGRLVAHLPPDEVPLLFSPDGRFLATGGQHGVVRLLDTHTGTEAAAFDWGIGPVYTAAFAPDGMTAAAAGRDFRVIVWDLE
jgi:WD40 repeat protein